MSSKLQGILKIAIEDLKLDHLYIIYPVDESFDMNDSITVKAL